MRKYLETTIQEIKDNKNPIILFGDTYAIHEALEELDFWKTVPVNVRNSGFYTTGRRDEVRDRKTVAKPFRFRVAHGRGYITQNDYRVDQVVPDITDIQTPID